MIVGIHRSIVQYAPFCNRGDPQDMKLSECPVRATADVIDGRWKPMIVNALKAKPLRFGQLLRALPEASRKVATEQLRELEREDIISRTAFGNRWERVEYSLTGYGRTLVPVLTLMAGWGAKHQRHKSRLSADAVARPTRRPQDQSRVEEPA
jgi:DNA-binding HxlR family transcriptional regulator